MPKFQATAYLVHERTSMGSLIIKLTDMMNCPEHTFDASSCDDVERGIEAFIERLKADQKPYQVNVSLRDGRAPKGYRATLDRKHWSVNTDLAPLANF